MVLDWFVTRWINGVKMKFLIIQMDQCNRRKELWILSKFSIKHLTSCKYFFIVCWFYPTDYFNLQWCSEQMRRLLFFIRNTHSRTFWKLPKHCVKFSICAWMFWLQKINLVVKEFLFRGLWNVLRKCSYKSKAAVNDTGTVDGL